MVDVALCDDALLWSSHRGAGVLLDINFKFDMVWLYRSPIPVGSRGLFYSFNDFYLPALRLEGGGSAPCAGGALMAEVLCNSSSWYSLFSS
jgi:hypothetical protein